MSRPKISLLLTILAVALAACGDQVEPAATEPVPAVSSTTVSPTTATSSPSPAPAEPATTTQPAVSEPEPDPAADVVVELELVGGAVVDDPGRVQAQAGDEVMIVVRSDTADEVHVHGYDIFGDLEPGSPLELRFIADIPGIYEVELEGSHLLLFELQVNG